MTWGEKFPHLLGLPGYETVAAREWEAAPAPGVDPAARDRVVSCPHRGDVLPHRLQPEGCGRCGELTACDLGKGANPAGVTLGECLVCKMGGRLPIP